MHHTNTSTVRSMVSKLHTLLHSVLAWYGTLVRLVCTFKQRTNVPYPYLHNRRVPYNKGTESRTWARGQLKYYESPVL